MRNDDRLPMDLFINRELSLLEFNQRVLAQPSDASPHSKRRSVF